MDEKTPADDVRDDAEARGAQEPARAAEVEVSGLEEPRKKGQFVSPLTCVVLLSGTLMLAAILVPNFVRARARGSLTACKSNLKNIGTALEMYSTDWSGKYPATMEMVVPNYLKTIPECPSAGTVTYRVQFGSTAPMNTQGYLDYYFIECSGENHTSVSVMANYPAYNGVQGLIERDPGAGY